MEAREEFGTSSKVEEAVKKAWKAVKFYKISLWNILEMKIKFLQTGGFAGLVKAIEIDCYKVSKEEAENLRGLADQIRFFDIPGLFNK